jgi:hypothetical protein
MLAFDEAGGVAYLTKVAAEHPQVFCTLLGKVLPMQVTGKDGGLMTLEMLVGHPWRSATAKCSARRRGKINLSLQRAGIRG